MPKPTVLFLCPDNSLLSPMAEAYLNVRGHGLIRAFSAGIDPAAGLNRHVKRLLSAVGISAQGLSPKPVDIFLMPHAEVPDRVIYLSDQTQIAYPAHWKATTSSHWWSVAGKPPFPQSFSACSSYFDRIAAAVDELISPPIPVATPAA